MTNLDDIAAKPPGIVARVGAALRLVATGKVDKTTWFGPLEPLQPVAPAEVAGRRWDYRNGWNLNNRPRGEGDERIGFPELRALAESCDVLRLVIETRKDQVSKLEWAIQPIDKSAEAANDPRCNEIQQFLKYPDKENDWDSWLRQLVEDMLVIDAATIYPRRTRGGDLYSLDLVDGATIKPVIDDHGRRPVPPEPAYQQVLKGLPAVDYTADELIYLPRNRRTHKVYGYSPVEQIVMTVNMALRRQQHQLQYYTEGTVPDAIAGVPDSWSPEQLDQFQQYWDALLSDNSAQKRKVRFAPGDIAKNFIQLKEGILKDEFDEWLARIVSYAFNVSSQWAVKQMNRATADSAQEQALQEGLTPLKSWIKSMMNGIIQTKFGYADLEWSWQDEEEQAPATQDAILAGQLKLGVICRNEYRAELGRDPVPDGDVYLIYTATGALTLDSVVNPPPPPPQLAPPKLGPDGQPLPDDSGDGKNTPERSGTAREAPGTNRDGADPAGGAKPDAQPDSEMTKVDASPKLRHLGPPDLDRPAARKARKALEILFRDLFKQEAKSVAAKSRNAVKPMLKADGVDDGDGDGILPLDAAAWDTAQKNVSEVLTGLATDGVSQGSAAVGVSTDLANPRAVEWAQNHAASLIKDLQGTTLDALRSVIAKGETEGWSVAQLAKAIEGDSAFSPDRAKLIASMETRTADYQANSIAWKAAREQGVDVGKSWIPRGDNICAECEANEADGVISADETFSSGDDAAPAHVGCECDVEPVLRGDDADTSEE